MNLRLMFYGLVFSILIVILLAVSYVKVGGSQNKICKPNVVTDMVVFDKAWQGTPINNAGQVYSALNSLSGKPFWKAKGDYGYFDIPDDFWIEKQFWLMPSRNYIWFAESNITPDVVYVYWFWDYPEFTDNYGKHFGIHPCKNFTISLKQAEYIYGLIR